jgi:hypothetical protein
MATKLFEKGHIKTGGRPKGQSNKMTVELRAMIRQALDEAGGVEYLVRQANENPTAFLALIGKIIPKEISATLQGISVVTINNEDANI